MDPLARKALESLLRAADRRGAGVAFRAPALTTMHLRAYQAIRTLQSKEAFEAVMKLAQDSGAVRLGWPAHQPDGYIQRIDLVDVDALAGLLGQVTLASRLASAREALKSKAAAFPVLQDVLDQWSILKRVRNTSPEDAGDWLDACGAIEACRLTVAAGQVDSAVRDASARIFRDSKRIEALTPLMDVVLCGSVEGAARNEAEVLQELGLFKEVQPVRLAGNVEVRRERGTFVLDRPYCALPPSTVLGLSGAAPSQVLTIENQTTFHVQARSRCESEELLIYTAGMPSPAWREMYIKLLRDIPDSVQIAHWGDFDEGGFRIAAFLARAAVEVGKVIRPWNMHPAEIPITQQRAATNKTVERMAGFALQAGWSDIAEAILSARFVAEQEG